MKSSRTLLSNQSGRDVGSTSLDRWLGYGQMEYRVANINIAIDLQAFHRLRDVCRSGEEVLYPSIG